MSPARPLTGRMVAVIAGLAFLAMLVPNIVLTVAALRSFSGLAVPDSYIASQEFDQLRAAQVALGWAVALEHSGDVLRLDVSDAQGEVVRPAALAVTVGRPTTTRSDRTLAIEETPSGYAALARLDPGNWRVEIAATAADGTAFRQSRDLWVKAPR